MGPSQDDTSGGNPQNPDPTQDKGGMGGGDTPVQTPPAEPTPTPEQPVEGTGEQGGGDPTGTPTDPNQGGTPDQTGSV